MDRENTRNRKHAKVILIILSIILFISIVLIIIFLKLYNDEKKVGKNKLIDLNEQVEKYNTLIEENKKLEEENELIKDIDNKENEARENYYQKLKEFEDLVVSGNTSYKIAYLTFDDGPYNLTYEFLRILRENNVLATFFTIGQGKEHCYDDYSKSCTEVYQDIAKEGHTMANHTYSHAIFYGLYDSSYNFMENVIKQEELVKSKTGRTTNIVRFPGGSATAGNLKNEIISKLRNRGYGWVDWTAQDGDGADIQDKDKAWQIFINSVNENIEVILFHDYNRVTLELLPDIITYLKDNNYVLLPLFYESKMVNK